MENDRKVDVHILTSHTATLKSMGSKRNSPGVHSVLCTPRLSVMWYVRRSFIRKHRNRFFLKLVDHRKAGRFLPHLPLACLQDSDWTCQNHIHKQLEENKHGMYLHSQQGALSNYGPCTENHVAQWKQHSNTNKGNYSFNLSFVQRIECNIYEPIP